MKKSLLFFAATFAMFNLVSCGDDEEDNEKQEGKTEQGVTFEAVDLGLSVKWATFNLGATAPEEFGNYYMWGDSKPMTDTVCDWANYKYCTGTVDTLTKYKSYGYVGPEVYIDNLSVIQPEDDAATVALGEDWHIPTYDDWNELRKSCSWKWMKVNGVSGFKVSSLKEGYEGNSIFLPASGFHLGQFSYSDNVYGAYWSATRDAYASAYAWGLRFVDWKDDFKTFVRCEGFSIRPVQKK